jgi:hypothetical protein
MTGSKLASRSRKTSIWTGPISVSTVFVRVPLREFPLAPDWIVAVVAQMFAHLRLQGGVDRTVPQEPELIKVWDGRLLVK